MVRASRSDSPQRLQAASAGQAEPSARVKPSGAAGDGGLSRADRLPGPGGHREQPGHPVRDRRPQQLGAQQPRGPVQRGQRPDAGRGDAEQPVAALRTEVQRPGPGQDVGLAAGGALGEVGEQRGSAAVPVGGRVGAVDQRLGDDGGVGGLGDADERDHCPQRDQRQPPAAALVQQLVGHLQERAAEFDGDPGDAALGQLPHVVPPRPGVRPGQTEPGRQQQFAAGEQRAYLVDLAGVHPAHRPVQLLLPAQHLRVGVAEDVEGEDLAEGQCGHGASPGARTVRAAACE